MLLNVKIWPQVGNIHGSLSRSTSPYVSIIRRSARIVLICSSQQIWQNFLFGHGSPQTEVPTMSERLSYLQELETYIGDHMLRASHSASNMGASCMVQHMAWCTRCVDSRSCISPQRRVCMDPCISWSSASGCIGPRMVRYITDTVVDHGRQLGRNGCSCCKTDRSVACIHRARPK